MRDLENDHDEAHTPNQIGRRAGTEQVFVGRGQGRGRGYRAFGGAQQIIPVLTALRQRGLIAQTSRPDGRSGVAYQLTDQGIALQSASA